MNDFKMCPVCGGKNVINGSRKWNCPDCGLELYNNVASAVGLVISDSDGNVLFERRGKEPRKGCLALPGGFVDPDETAEEACLRECLEECGVKPVSLKYICSFPNTYEFKNFTYKTCDLFFEAVLPADAKLVPQEGEVLSFEKHDCSSAEKIDKLDIAFPSTQKTLKLWCKK